MDTWILKYPLKQWYARLHAKHIADCLFIHINKTGGSSIERALGLPFQHRTAVEMMSIVGRRRWRRKFTFAFVRNPWDKAYSHYRFRVRTNQTGLGDRPIPFPEWVRQAYGERNPRYYRRPLMFQPQMEWIGDKDGHVLVEFVGRFERLHEDFAEVCRVLDRDAELPHLKSSGARADYREVYDDSSALIIAERFAADIERFGYTFD